MAIGLDDALLGWLVASVGDGLVRSLRGDPVRAAMRAIVKEAVAATVAAVLPDGDAHQRGHLGAALMIRDLPVGDERVRITDERQLHAALRRWTAALDRPEFEEPGYLSRLRVDPTVLASTLTSRIVDGIRQNAERGGVLAPLAEWMWRDGVSADLGDIKRAVASLADERTARRPPEGGGWLKASDYLETIRNIAPRGDLLDRHDELDELAAFCAGGEAYLWWQGAPWAGKSALMSTFVLDPPDGVEVAAFFVNGRVDSESDSDAFSAALAQQLSHVQPPTEPAGKRRLPALLAKAATAAAAQGRRLLLVVDGLDEDRGGPPESRLASIASLLPKAPPANLRIIIASRPDRPLPADVPPDHPLRSCRIRHLSSSPHAAEIAHQARLELDGLLTAEPSRRVLGLVTASGGALSLDDLEELTRHPRDQLERLLAGSFARTIRYQMTASRLGETPGLQFSHETLLVEATKRLGRALGEYRDEIHAWAAEYQRRGWPEETPLFLLRAYADVLRASRDSERLRALVVDRARHDRLLWLSGGDAAALDEIALAERLLLEDADPDLAALLRLAVERERLAHRNVKLPTALPMLWVTLGYPHRGEATALAFRSHYQVGTMIQIARHLLDSHEYESAVRVASAACEVPGIVGRIWLGKAKEVLVEALVAHGAYDKAEQVVRDAPEAPSVDLPVRLVTTLAAAGQHDRAERLARSDRALSRTLLGALAQAWVGGGDHERAVDAAGRIEEPDRRRGYLVGLVRILVQASKVTEAQRLASELTDRRLREAVNTELAEALLDAGDPHQARPAAERAGASLVPAVDGIALANAGEYHRAVASTARLPSPDRRVRTLTRIAELAARAGDGGHAVRFVTTAAQNAIRKSIGAGDSGRYLRDSYTSTLVAALTRSGALACATQAAGAITDPATQVTALTGVIDAAGARGDARQVSTLAIRARYKTTSIRSDLRMAQARSALAASVAAGLAEAGQFRLAAQAFRDVDPRHVRIDAAKAVIRRMVSAGEVGRAVRLARERDDPPSFTRQMLIEVVRTLVACGEWDEADRFAWGVDRWGARDEFLQIVADGRAGSGAYDRAIATIDAISSTTRRVESLVEVARVLDADGHRARAIQIAQQAETIAKTPYPYRQAWLLTAVCRALLSAGRVDEAAAVVSAIDKPLNEVHRLANQISVAMAAGRHKEALRLAGTADRVVGSMSRVAGYLAATAGPAEAVGLLGRVLGETVGALTASGDYARAKRLVAGVEQPDLRSMAQGALVDRLAAAGEGHRAAETAEAAVAGYHGAFHPWMVLNPAIATAAVTCNPRHVAPLLPVVERSLLPFAGHEHVYWLPSLIRHLAELGERRLADRFLAAAPERGRGRHRAQLTLGLLIRGDLDVDAVDAASADDHHRNEALIAALARAVGDGQHERADAILTQIGDPQDRVVALSRYARAIAGTANLRARQLLDEAATLLGPQAVPPVPYPRRTAPFVALAEAALACGDRRVARRAVAEALVDASWADLLATVAKVEPAVIDLLADLDPQTLTS